MNDIYKSNNKKVFTDAFNSFIIYISIIYVICFIPLFNKEGVLNEYGDYLNFENINIFIYLLIVFTSIFLTYIFINLTKKIFKNNYTISKKLISLIEYFMLSLTSIFLFTGIYLIYVGGTTYRHEQMFDKLGILSWFNVILNPLIYIYTLVLTIILIQYGNLIYNLSKNTFHRIYSSLIFCTLTIFITSTSSSDMILFFPSILIILNPRKEFKFILIKSKAIRKNLLFISAILTPITFYTAQYSLKNKNYLNGDFGILELISYISTRFTTHSKSLYTYLFLNPPLRFNPITLLERRFCIIFSNNCGDKDFITSGAINFLNTFSTDTIYAGSSPGFLASFMMTNNFIEFFVASIWILLILGSCYQIIHNLLLNKDIINKTKIFRSFLIYWSCFGLFGIYLNDPLDGLSIISPNFILPFFSYLLNIYINSLNKNIMIFNINNNIKG